MGLHPHWLQLLLQLGTNLLLLLLQCPKQREASLTPATGSQAELGSSDVSISSVELGTHVECLVSRGLSF